MRVATRRNFPSPCSLQLQTHHHSVSWGPSDHLSLAPDQTYQVFGDPRRGDSPRETLRLLFWDSLTASSHRGQQGLFLRSGPGSCLRKMIYKVLRASDPHLLTFSERVAPGSCCGKTEKDHLQGSAGLELVPSQASGWECAAELSAETRLIRDPSRASSAL